MSYVDFWWDQVPAGAGLLEKLAEAIRQRSSVLLDTSELCWKGELIARVRRLVTAIDHTLPWVMLDASRCPEGYSPPALLMESCIGPNEVYTTDPLRLRELRKTPACVWVQNIPDAQQDVWQETAVRLSRERSGMMLILELPGRGEDVQSPGCISLGCSCSRFDLYYFALLQLSNRQLDEMMIEYAATLCTEIAGGDPCRCGELCVQVNRLLADPSEVCAELLSADVLRQAVSRAQIRSINPLIDVGRVQLVDLVKATVEEYLPFEDNFKINVDRAGKVELRHLVYLRDNKGLRIEEELNGILDVMHRARNRIAHLHILSYEEINRLFTALRRLEAICGAREGMQ